MDSIPLELVDYILDNLHSENIQFIYNLRLVNNNFKNHIDRIQNIKKVQCENIFNKLAYKGLYINFKWLFDNNIEMSINNINNLIIHKRTNIFDLLIKYDYLHNLLFNRFNLFSYKNEIDIISLSKSNNPLITAGINYDKDNSNLDIIKILLNDKIVNNPFIHQIPGLFEISIKYNNTVLIKYLVTYYYDIIKHLQHKLSYLILSSNREYEDIFYYLIENKKYDINEQFLNNCVKRRYNELFIYSINRNDNKYNMKHFIESSINFNNLELFKYILNYDKKINFNKVINTLLNPDLDRKLSFTNILIDDYLDRINTNTLLIRVCLINNLSNNNIIINLIEKNFKVTIEDIKFALDNQNIILVQHLSTKFNTI